ncbi:flagellar hook capping FlgD N-terminal domain-containing protein [Alicyclobacillus dauci]|uniref:Flagellar hook capping protein n=1 Tax=Alicyclobacillus dauci TaxID=1475485 RepID=A0ABY6YXW8_9BACL|nr:flagellar hook capping FlgD N-terminal domain-containing protein [Alicyclobacillus dauci]WAH35401.1 flagellar hook capping protein [Alicyclobacillus dauci]
MTTPVSSTASTTSSSSSPVLNQSQQLGQDDFLKLLVAQMQNQDPLQPQDNSQMLAQLAQFTSVEQMTNVAQTETQVLSAINSLQTLMAPQMIGKSVTIDDGSGTPIQGTVDSVKFSQGQSQVVVNGTAYPTTQVVQMS